MKYITIEIQTMENGNIANLTSVWDTWAQAESAYHTILAAAAQSNLPAHACTMLDSEGCIINWQCYKPNTEEQ